MTNNTCGAVLGAIQVKATLDVVTPDATSDSERNSSITSSIIRWQTVQSSRPDSSVSYRRVYTAPTPSEVLVAAFRTPSGMRSVMHKNSLSLAFVLNTVKRLLEQHTVKYQLFLPLIRKNILRLDDAYALETSRRSGRNPTRYSPSRQCMSAHMLHQTRPTRAYSYRQKWATHWPSGRLMSRQTASGRYIPWHLPSG